MHDRHAGEERGGSHDTTVCDRICINTSLADSAAGQIRFPTLASPSPYSPINFIPTLDETSDNQPVRQSDTSLMTRLVAFGNNITGNLHPTDSEPVLSLTDITEATGCTEIIWHSWTCSIGRGGHSLPFPAHLRLISGTKGSRAWGSIPDGLRELLETGVEPVKFIGHDAPEGYLGQDGHVHRFDGTQSIEKWADVAMSSLGEVYTISDKTIYRFPSFDEVLKRGNREKEGEVRGDKVTLYALESRCFVKVDDHLFELKDKLTLVDDLEGLGISVVEGRRNRLGVVTDAGDAYVFDSKSAEPALLELKEDVRLLGLGSEFDLLVTETKVLARGDSG